MKAKSENNNSLMVLPPGVEVSPVGLKITGKLSYRQWADMMEQLEDVHHSILWVIGDGLVYGEDTFGQEFSQVISEYAKQTQYNAMYVARNVSIYRRVGKLSWSHHAEVAMLEGSEQERFLELAIKKRLKVHELRAAVRLFRNPLPKPGDWHDTGDGPEVVPDVEPEFQEVAEVKPSYYTETTEHVRDDFIPPSPVDPEKEFRHLFGLAKALRRAEKERDDKTAVRLRTALDIFISEREGRPEP